MLRRSTKFQGPLWILEAHPVILGILFWLTYQVTWKAATLKWALEQERALPQLQLPEQVFLHLTPYDPPRLWRGLRQIKILCGHLWFISLGESQIDRFLEQILWSKIYFFKKKNSSLYCIGINRKKKREPDYRHWFSMWPDLIMSRVLIKYTES